MVRAFRLFSCIRKADDALFAAWGLPWYVLGVCTDWVPQKSIEATIRVLEDEMNPKRAYGSYTNIGPTFQGG